MTPRQRMSPGSIRHTLTVLGAAALAVEAALALVGGLPAMVGGLALITATGLVIARYVSGADAQDSGNHRTARTMGSREPGLGDWYWTVRNGLDRDGFHHPLRPQLQRLYAARLSETHGVSLTEEPGRAAALVGPALWPWIDPEHNAPQRTVPEPVLRALVDRLDTL